MNVALSQNVEKNADSNNVKVRRTEQILGPYNYGNVIDEEDHGKQRVERRPHELDNGVIYHG